MKKQAARLDPNSEEYRNLQSMIETEELKLFTANVDVQSSKKTLDKTADTLVDVRNGVKEKYGVDTVEGMNNVAADMKRIANEDSELIAGLESDLGKFNHASTDNTEVDRTADVLKQAEKKQKQQHDFADTAAAIQPDADLDSKLSNVSAGYSVASNVVKPVISDVHDTKKEQMDSFNKRGGYGLTEEEMKMLQEEEF